ncbi:LytR/AlgR family response regulator transcription factor [Hyunsoonleella aestuarii]|uniref:LytTR family DNA-binding domain-containing protein n=1 Tax=Hyunsoonleella aestuarii TaxID=912802 RepID=A0ABP8E841_9FLAO|nr:LytTR family DNA-binding domain-containing protein [Hyunsoonleella aestuarii]
MFKSIIIDDELLARKRILNLIKNIDNIDVIGECANGEDAINKINSLNPDLIFLDIEMKDMNGFDVLAKIDKHRRPLIIFVTAYDEFALKAFDFFAFDYLLKPFENERFLQSVQKAIENLQNNIEHQYFEKVNELLKFIGQNSNQKSNVFMEKFPIRVGNKINFIEQSDIKYILASGSYPEIQTLNKTITVRDSLNNLIKQLNADKFIRIHRSVIINISYVLEVIHSSYYELDVKMTDGKLFRVSKSYRKAINKKLGL